MAIDPITEAQYVFSDRYPSRAAVYAEIAAASALVRSQRPAWLDRPYGPHPRERVDLFPGRHGSPLLVFVHGGYWRSQRKEDYAFAAGVVRRHGLSVAVIGYPLAPDRTLADIVHSLRAAMAWLHGSGRMLLPAWRGTIVAGHSAGGHLAAMLACDPEWGPRVAGCMALSGLFDLAPLLRTSIAQAVGIDEVLARRLSPMARPAGPGWLVAAVGADETPAFHAQAAGYTAHWSGAPQQEGRAQKEGRAQLLVVPGADHYSILRQVADADTPVMRALLDRAFAAEEAL